MNIKKKILFTFVLLLGLIFFVYINYKTDSKGIINNAVLKENYIDLNLSLFSDMDTTKKEGALIPKKTIALKTGCNLSVSAKSIPSDGQLQYLIKLINQGSTSCINTSMSVYYDDSLDFISSTPTATASNYYWELGNIGQGDAKLISIVLQAGHKKIQGIDTQACATANNSTDACTSTLENPIISTVAVTPAKSVIKGPALPSVIKNNKDFEYGSWVWVSPIAMSQDYMRKVVDGAALNNINVLYVTIDDYLEIEMVTDVNIKNARKKNYINAIERFVRIAKDKNISVELEAGWRDWAEEENKNKAFAIVDFVIDYNDHHSSKIKAIQYDIEPYLLSSYANNKVRLLKNFISLIDESAERIGTNQIGLSVVIPHFYDDKQEWTPSVEYKGLNTYTYNHILGILDKRKDSKLIIMAYRNFAENNGGSIDLAYTEINEASFGPHATKIIVGLESGDVKPGYVTFFSLTKAYYLEQKELILNEFSTKSGFGGIAIHYIDSFLDLK